jgi:hypothetical protein
MCPCEAHWNSTKPCTCNCAMHEGRRNENTNTHTTRVGGPLPMTVAWPEIENDNTHTARPESD